MFGALGLVYVAVPGEDLKRQVRGSEEKRMLGVDEMEENIDWRC